MKTNVYCLATDKGLQNFYLEACGETYYLFSQNYRRGVKAYFGQGVHIDAAMDFSRAHNNTAILNTMRKLPSYIKYIEKEYGIEVLRKTARKNAYSKRSVA
jgi:hypothetical protein